MLKRVNTIKLFLLFIFFAAVCQAQSQNGSRPDMQTLLSSKNYLFTAQYAQPMTGNQVTLTSTYTLHIAGDSLVCHLPYYGRAYSVESYPGGGGLDFVSHHFDYGVMPAKHGRFTITININDLTTVQQMYMNVSKSGYASLQALPINKQAITYYGIITILPVTK